MKFKKILSVFLVVVMITGILSASTFAENVPAAATVYFTVSNQGILASDKENKPMGFREVTVEDIDLNGSLSFDEALIALHKKYNSEEGYSAPGGFVGKLWGVSSSNISFFINHRSFSGNVTTAPIENGDYLLASVNKDNLYYSDWYSYFDATEKAVRTNEEFTLTLKGHLGMAFEDEDKVDIALPGIKAGTMENGEFIPFEGMTTDSEGKVTLSFDTPGTYYVSASGTVKDTVSDWSQPPYDGSVTVEADCPVIPPVCVVNVIEEGINVYLTVSNKGVIASANDGSIMANRPVRVTDINGDGKLTFSEALASAHKTYHREEGYEASGSVSKLWGIETANTLCFINDVGLTGGVSSDTVEEGDYLTASINLDESGCYADWYSFFDSNEKEVKINENFVLNLKGFYGMAYPAEAPSPLNGISIGIWNNGVFSEIPQKVTDTNGNVSLSFDSEGIYYVTASGTVRDTVMNWGLWQEVEMDCPIIAPVCKVTVSEGEAEIEPSLPVMSDEEAANIIYTEFSDKDKNYSNTTKTPLVFPLEYKGTVYENVAEYLKAWALYNTGKQVIVNYIPYIYTTTYDDWSTGELKKISYNGMDLSTGIHQDYFTNNAEKYMNRLDEISFTVGNVTTDTIEKLCIGVKSKIRTQEEIVEYIATQLPFERIINTNSSKDKITDALGEKSGYSVVLPNQSGLYSSAIASIEWSLENISGAADAFSINKSTRKTTVLRPNVGDENAVFDLTATIKSMADTTVSKIVTHRISIPAFEGVVVPIEITEGATLTLTDKYYKKLVDSKYIVKAETATEGYDLYYCTLHKSATGTAQKFDYEVSKDGYITTTDTISVDNGNPEKIVITLSASTEDDAKLASLSLKKPVSDSHDIISGISFDKDTYEYNIKVSGIRTIEFNAEAVAEGATVKITSYYKSTADANSGKLTTGSKAISTKCYLPDSADSLSTVVITVTAPESSIQEIKTRTYKINIEKTAPSSPLTALTLTPVSSTGGKKDSWAGEDGLSPVEGEFKPAFVTGTRAVGVYTVNYWFDKIKIMPTTVSGTVISVDEETVASGKQSKEIPLAVGENKIPMTITDAGGVVTNYTITVYRKSRLEIVSAEVEKGAINNPFTNDGSERSNSGRFSHETDVLRMKFNTNIADNSGVNIRIKLDKKEYSGKAGEYIEIPVKDMESAMLFVFLHKEVNGVNECQAYIINMTRMSATSPDSIETYLPAPGQFVNQKIYLNPEASLTGTQMVTLGSFGGNVVYKYNTPIKNDPLNPYGIDFIIVGNAFTNSDGTSAPASSEPASVMVSKDGESWYELAGSEYYDANTLNNITVTYKNPDTDFLGAVDIPWTDNSGESGFILKNGHHTQSYYPDPMLYNVYQNGIGKNETYTKESVSFTGTKILSSALPAFGYADNHAAGDYSNSPAANPKGSKAANPYLENHYSVYNGDGFDLAWAVNGDGNPVELDSISYIKIYNPKITDSSSTGEKSPEILKILRAEPDNEAVGTTSPLKELNVNGKKIELKDDEFTYTVDGEGASTLTLLPIHENKAANIYISGKRVTSDKSSEVIAAVNKLRIIVQEEKREPVIYILNFTNVKTRESNADLKNIILTPGDVTSSPDGENKISFTVPGNVSSVRLVSEFNYQKATALLSGDGVDNILLENKKAGNPVSLKYGENIFTLTVTSYDKSECKEYKIIITREGSSGGTDSSNTDTIRVKFSLTGDKIHYNKTTNKNTGAHTNPTWISTQTVEIPKNSTVKYLTELMLNNAGLDYTLDGTYIQSINGIGEFDNGPNSGWLYRVNGKILDEGYEAKKLKNNDTVKWFYSDDYTKEKGYVGNFDGISSGGSVVTKTENSETVSENVFTDNTFNDVKADDWYYESVKYVYEKNLMQGTNNGFEPDTPMSRAMLVTVLFRMAKPEITKKAHSFTDVYDNEWYSDAINWAAKEGIVSGVSDSRFEPLSPVTREQMALIIYRFAKTEGYDVTQKTDISVFYDSRDISSWAVDALSWANKTGLIKGVSETGLSPKTTATRAQVAAIITRFCQNKSY